MTSCGSAATCYTLGLSGRLTWIAGCARGCISLRRCDDTGQRGAGSRGRLGTKRNPGASRVAPRQRNQPLDLDRLSHSDFRVTSNGDSDDLTAEAVQGHQLGQPDRQTGRPIDLRLARIKGGPRLRRAGAYKSGAAGINPQFHGGVSCLLGCGPTVLLDASPSGAGQRLQSRTVDSNTQRRCAKLCVAATPSGYRIGCG